MLVVCINNSTLGSHSHQLLHGAIQFSVYANHIRGRTFGTKAIVFRCFPFNVAFTYRIPRIWNPSFTLRLLYTHVSNVHWEDNNYNNNKQPVDAHSQVGEPLLTLKSTWLGIRTGPRGPPGYRGDMKGCKHKQGHVSVSHPPPPPPPSPRPMWHMAQGL